MESFASKSLVPRAQRLVPHAQARFAILAVGLTIFQFGCTDDRTGNDLFKNSKGNHSSQPQPRPDDAALQQMVASTLQYNLDHRLLSADRNAAWQVLHGIIAYGRDLPLKVGDTRPSAVEYLLGGGELTGWDLFPGTDLGDGRTGVRAHVEASGYKSQGHVDQWLAILAQIDEPITSKVMVAGKEHTIADWIDQSLLDVPNNPMEEYSWTVISANYYRPDRQHWPCIDGSEIDINTLVDFEAEQNINESACGGSHRLMALARAINYAHSKGIADQTGFLKAQQTLDRNMRNMRQYQNSDGSLSSNYFERPGASADLSQTISATGHQIEVAAYAVSDADIKSEWLERAVVRWCEMLEATKDQDLECGGLYHGLKGLRIYHDRRFGTWKPTSLK